jgi:hypothetical protein
MVSSFKMIISVGCLFSLAGCEAWPRHNALPDQDDDLTEVDGDLSAFVDVAWIQGTETSNANDYGFESPDEWVLTVGAGVWLQGKLDGTGYANGTPERLDQDGCAFAPTIRSPYTDGDYTGDVDVQVLQLAEEGTLCVDVATDSDVIFDVLLFPLDACGFPGQPLNSASGYPLGIDSQDGTGHWEQELSAGTYGVQTAAWRPDDEARLVPYEITLALMPSNPHDLVHCPSVLEKS